MDQAELRQLEKKCIQEEAPQCVAACPIHVDARSFIGLVRNRAWDDAWKVLRKTMPFPGILGRICDAPCKERCKRGEAGDPVEIGALEKICVSKTPPDLRLPPIVPKGKRVAVLGSGLDGLTVAWDLAKKGCQVTIFEPGTSLGGNLRNLSPQILPPDIIDRETAVLNRLGVNVQLEATVPSESLLAQLKDDFDAVYMGPDAVGAVQSGLKKNAHGKVEVDLQSRMTGMEGVFACVSWEQSLRSPVWQAAEGRWAATSMDRYIQKVSMTAGREKEGPYATRLYTNMKGVSETRAVQTSDPDMGYADDEAALEARRCLQCECLECVKVCPYLAHYKAYPKKYIREIYNNESIVMGTRHSNKFINSCSLCGLCERVCPENFPMQDVCMNARLGMVQRNKMPPSAHEFALLDMAFSQGPRFSLVRHEPEHSSSAYVFFPGCQLCASSPDKVFETYSYFRRKIKGGVGLMLDCCAAPAHWAGRTEKFQDALKSLERKWTDLGNPVMITACSTCHKMFRDHLSEMEVLSLWEMLMQVGLPETSRGPSGNKILAVHDPCTTRNEPEIQRTIRHLLKTLDIAVEELPLAGELTECCGFGGLMQNANPEVAKKTVLGRARLSPSDYVTYCGMCRDNLGGAGKRIIHILDLIFPGSRNADPASEKPPGWSLRQENRARLKERFKAEVWNERTSHMEAHLKIKLLISPALGEILERRRILEEDLQKVVYNAEKTGNKFENVETGRFKASYKPYKATFWVEYGPSENGFIVYNAYSHRMEAIQA